MVVQYCDASRRGSFWWSPFPMGLLQRCPLFRLIGGSAGALAQIWRSPAPRGLGRGLEALNAAITDPFTHEGTSFDAFVLIGEDASLTHNIGDFEIIKEMVDARRP